MNKAINKLKDLINAKNVKYSIENMARAYQLLSNPLENIVVIHVAGTNGKGSVCHKIAKSLMHAGYKVGLFSSPHISTIRERIMVNFAMISESDFKNQLSDLFEALESFKIELSFFEIITLLACMHFKKNHVDFAVIETGLGGRLDATNVIKSNIHVITSIGFDHQHLLGSSLDEIAKEKAGIIKSNAPTVLGPLAIYQPILEKADKFLSKTYKITDNFLYYDEENQSISKAVLKLLKKDFHISDDSITSGIKSRPICRFEVFKKDNQNFPKALILDVAHNIDGLKRLKSALDQKFGLEKYTILLGISKDKNINEFCEYLLSFSKEIHLADSNHPRLIAAKELAQVISDKAILYTHASFSDAVKTVIKNRDDHVLVLGSFYFMSEIREALGIEQKSDKFYLNDPALKP